MEDSHPQESKVRRLAKQVLALKAAGQEQAPEPQSQQQRQGHSTQSGELLDEAEACEHLEQRLEELKAEAHSLQQANDLTRETRSQQPNVSTPTRDNPSSAAPPQPHRQQLERIVSRVESLLQREDHPRRETGSQTRTAIQAQAAAVRLILQRLQPNGSTPTHDSSSSAATFDRQDQVTAPTGFQRPLQREAQHGYVGVLTPTARLH